MEKQRVNTKPVERKKLTGLKKILIAGSLVGATLLGLEAGRNHIKNNYGPGFSKEDVETFKSFSEAKDKLVRGLIKDAFIPAISEAAKEDYHNKLEQAVNQSGENYNPVFDFPYLDPFNPHFDEDVESINNYISSKQKSEKH